MNNHFMYPVKLLRNLCKNEKRNARFVAVTGQAFNVLGDETVNVRSSMLLGVLLAMPYEYPEMSFTIVDLPHPPNKNDVNISELFLSAFKSECNNNLQAIRGNKIWTRKNIRFSSKSKWDSPLLSKKGTVLITGGLGNLGLFLAEYLSERFQANIILTRKHFFPEREKWENYIQKNPNSQNAKIIQKLKYLEDQHGSKILTFQALVDNEIEMNKLVKTCEAKLGKIDGVIHAAGLTKMTAMKTIEKIDETTLEQHLRPKLDGAKTLASLEYNQRPDFFLFTSSLSVFVGGFGLGAYVAANACMDTLTGQLALAGERVLSINFNGLDLHPNNKGIDLMAKNGDFLSNTDAKKMFSIFFTTKLDQVIVSRHVPNINTLLTDREINIHTNRSTNVTRKDLVLAKTDLERQIIRLFEDLLGSSPIGMTDNFFELGGNSLVAAQLNARISSNLNIELPFDRVLSNPTPEGICTVILEDKLAKNNLPENILEILETLSEDEAKKYLENLKNE
jgi:NAD(P)-dependent dehydrogenase (short-subunit alcohol dehydrogenase family)/acyl carrier protein